MFSSMLFTTGLTSEMCISCSEFNRDAIAVEKLDSLCPLLRVLSTGFQHAD
jgi:hypothetical protein